MDNFLLPGGFGDYVRAVLTRETGPELEGSDLALPRRDLHLLAQPVEKRVGNATARAWVAAPPSGSYERGKTARTWEQRT